MGFRRLCAGFHYLVQAGERYYARFYVLTEPVNPGFLIPIFKAGAWTDTPYKHFTHGDQTTATIKSLSPFTKYEFRISARNQIGTSELSDPVVVSCELSSNETIIAPIM